MLARLCALVVWALVAATTVFWGLRLLVRAPPAPTAAVVVGDATSTRVDLTRLLGATPVAVAAAPGVLTEAGSRFRLLGIMAPKPSATGRAHGVALIAVDGKLPRAYQVGAAVDGEMLLQSVSLRSAALGSARGGPGVTLELPPLPTAATGTLPAPGQMSGQIPGQLPGQAPVPVSVVPGLAQRIAAQTMLPQVMPVPPFAAPQVSNPGGVVPQPPPPREPGTSPQ